MIMTAQMIQITTIMRTSKRLSIYNKVTLLILQYEYITSSASWWCPFFTHVFTFPINILITLICCVAHRTWRHRYKCETHKIRWWEDGRGHMGHRRSRHHLTLVKICTSYLQVYVMYRYNMFYVHMLNVTTDPFPSTFSPKHVIE